MTGLRLRLSPPQLHKLLVLVVLGLGIAVRGWHFPAVPPGLNQDEAASAYEAFSLAETGCDKWGNHLPVYFPAWGSGQNVLLAYLTIPVIRVFGLNIFAARLVPLLLGLLTLPLFYYCLRPLGRYPALLGLLLLAVAPWHFMLSRWGLESNLVPFWMLLGCTTLSRAISTQRRRWIIPSLLPFALALYAYGLTFVVLPPMLGLVLLACFGRIRQRPGAWLLALGLFVLVASPLTLFLVENYALGHNLAWTDKLFFATPLLPATRLSQDGDSSWRDFYEINSAFIVGGFNDELPYNQLPGYPLLLRFTWSLAAVGFMAMLYQLGRWRGRLAEHPSGVVALVLLAWGLACGPLVFLLRLNVNRVNHFFLPCLALAAWGLALVINNLNSRAPKLLIRGMALAWFGLEGGLAARYYVRHYPEGPIKAQFNSGLPAAFATLRQLRGMRQVYITPQLPLSYVYTLFYLRYPPARFRREVRFEVDAVEGAYQVQQFGRYVFDSQYLKKGAWCGYLTYAGGIKSTPENRKTLVFSDGTWEVGTFWVPGTPY